MSGEAKDISQIRCEQRAADYERDISRAHPGLIILLIDLSSSMADKWSANGGPKLTEVSRIVNRFLEFIAVRSIGGYDEEAKTDIVYNYLTIGMFYYFSDTVISAWDGPLRGRGLVAISEILNGPLGTRAEHVLMNLPDGKGGYEPIETEMDFPYWIDEATVAEKAFGLTPMCKALATAAMFAAAWAKEHQDSFPPIVFNITDGQAKDATPDGVPTNDIPLDPAILERAARLVTDVRTDDGNALLFNVHLSSMGSGECVMFPTREPFDIGDPFAGILFRISSPIPGPLINEARKHAQRIRGAFPELEIDAIRQGSRGFVFNSDASVLAAFLRIGTRT